MNSQSKELDREREPSGERYILFVVASLVIVFDQLSKLLVEAWLPLNQSWTPVPGLVEYFKLTHVSNTGAAFGLFPSGSLVFTVVATLVTVVIVIYNFRMPAGHRLLRVALALQMGGALGNLIDRLRLGHVTDFLDFGPWPVFNLADTAIVAGVIILGFLMLQEQRDIQEDRREEQKGATDLEQQEAHLSAERVEPPARFRSSLASPPPNERTS